MKPNPLLSLSFDFSVEIVKYCFSLQKEEKEFILSKQLIRSGTSVGANIEESQGAISKPDFIHKLHISLKEARESFYWLRIINEIDSLNFNPNKTDQLMKQCKELIYLLTCILKTSKQNLKR